MAKTRRIEKKKYAARKSRIERSVAKTRHIEKKKYVARKSRIERSVAKAHHIEEKKYTARKGRIERTMAKTRHIEETKYATRGSAVSRKTMTKTHHSEEDDVLLKIAIPIPPEDNYPNYFMALANLGAEGVKATKESNPAEFDGLLLPGGGDADPHLYGQENTGSNDIDPALDELQLAVLDRFYRAGKKIFGICRGHQLLNVYFGGTLIQDISSGKIHDWDEGKREDKVHSVISEPDSWLERLYGSRFSVNSAHHQAVDSLGRGLIVDLRSEDGIIEGMHHVNGNVFSVQWHPERMCFQHQRDDTVDGSNVLRWFLNQCKASN